MTSDFSSIKLCARPENIPPVLAYAEQLAERLGFDSEERFRIRLALEETLQNVVKHGYADDPGGLFTVRFEPFSTGLRLVIREKGIPYDPALIPEFRPEALSLGGDTKGLGTYLTRRSMDEVHFQNLGREGHEVVLLKRLSSKKIDGESGTKEEEARTEAPPPPGDSPTYVVRGLQPRDSIEVSRCAYKTYGYVYEDFIYYPEQIAELNETGRMISAVAVSEDGRILGHCALKRDDANEATAEMGVLFVLPRYRHGGIARDLHAPLFQAGKEAGLRSVYVRAVAGHVASQKLALSMGFHITGILLGAFPENVKFKELTGTIPQKMSGVLLWRPLGDPRERAVFAPAPYRRWIESLYEATGIPAEFREDGGAEKEREKSHHLRVKKTETLNIAEMEVRDYGPEALQQFRCNMHRLLLERTDVIYATLNMEDAGVLALAEAIADEGFLFAGILPDRLGGRDALVLQYLNNLALDCDAIRLATPMARQLLNDLRVRDRFQAEG